MGAQNEGRAEIAIKKKIHTKGVIEKYNQDVGSTSIFLEWFQILD